MSKTIVTASPQASYRDLWIIIFKKHIHAIPIINQDKKLQGIVSEEDLLKPLYPDYKEFINDFISASNFEEMEEKIEDLVNLTAKHVMCKSVIFARGDTPILRALSRMIVRTVRQLPVLSTDGKLIGMVSKSDIFNILFLQHLLQKAKHPKKSKPHHVHQDR